MNYQGDITNGQELFNNQLINIYKKSMLAMLGDMVEIKRLGS